MPLSEARKKANAKWDKKNMVVLSCKVSAQVATTFREVCQRNGTTVNAVLVKHIKEYIQETPE